MENKNILLLKKNILARGIACLNEHKKTVVNACLRIVSFKWAEFVCVFYNISDK